jgi:hypothetical protein
MANKLGSKYLVINNAYGIEVGHYIQCADIAYSIQEGTTVVGIFDDLTLPASTTKIVKISNGLLKDLPSSAGIQAGYTLNPLASNAKHVRVGEKIQLYTYSAADTDWVEIKSYSAITGTSTDILTVVDSYRSTVDPTKWIVKVAEAVSVEAGDRAEVALSEFTIIDKETLPEWAPGTNYTIGTRVVDAKGIVYKCISDNTAGVDSMPSNVRYWAPSEYGFTFNSYSDCFASSQRFGFRTATTLGSVVQYPGASLYLNTEAYIIFKTMDLPLQLNTSVQAEFIKYDGS